MVLGSSLIKYIKAGGPREAMGGTGGSPPNFLYFTFLYVKSGGEPPVLPIAFLHFLFLNYNYNINIIYIENSNLIKIF